MLPASCNWLSSVTPSYLVRLVVQFNIQTKADYIRLHNLRPDIVPSFNVVRRVFGTFSSLYRTAVTSSSTHNLSKYIALRLHLRKTPTIRQCTASGINLGRLKGLYGSKREVDDFVEQALKAIEKERPSDA